MIDPLRDEAVWLLTKMHKAKAIVGVSAATPTSRKERNSDA